MAIKGDFTRLARPGSLPFGMLAQAPTASEDRRGDGDRVGENPEAGPREKKKGTREVGIPFTWVLGAFGSLFALMMLSIVRGLFDRKADNPFAFLEELEPAEVAILLAKERPQVAAGALSFLDPEFVDMVMGEMPAKRQEELTNHLTNDETMPLVKQRAVAAHLSKRLGLKDPVVKFQDLV